MNAIMALLTAASVLAHAALGCCIHHSHDPSAARLAGEAAQQPDKDHHSRCATCCRHSQSNQTDHSPLVPCGNCSEQDCVAVAGGPPTVLLKATDTAFRAAALDDL